MGSAWAKTNYQTPGSPDFLWHSVRGHAVDTAAAMRCLLQGATLRRLETSANMVFSPVHLDRLCVFGGMHDIGKTLNGFNTKRRGDRSSFACHTRPVIDFLERLQKRFGQENLYGAEKKFLASSGLADLLGWFGGDRPGARALRILFSHHGGCRQEEPSLVGFEKQIEPNDTYDPLAEAAHVMDAMRQLFPAAFTADVPVFPDCSDFQHMVLGLVQTADWHASNIGNHDKPYGTLDFAGDDFDAGERYHSSCSVIAANLDQCGFHGPFARTLPFALDQVTGRKPFRPIQQAVSELPLESQVVGIEAPTGEGKTEAALIRFLRLYEAGLVDGLYFAVPTRSAGSSLFRRIAHLFKSLVPDCREPILGLPGVQSSIPGGPEEGTVTWSSDTGNLLTAGIAVGTIDQILLSGLRARNSHHRVLASARLFLVIDEVHAFDAFMTSILANTLTRHVKCGGHVAMMSATFGRSGFEAFGQTLPTFDESLKAPYPALWHGRDFNSFTEMAIPAEPGRQRQIAVDITGFDSAADAVADAVRSGARCLAIFSTVASARQFQEALSQRKVPVLSLDTPSGKVPVLHHGRYAGPDRVRLDDAVDAALGRSAASGDGIAIVGTQSVEQSLDIDADFLVSDICPMEVFLQRLGRLHRWYRNRPEGFAVPRALLVSPGSEVEWVGAGGKANFKLLPQVHVYKSAVQLRAMASLIREKRVLNLPEECRALVERTTHPEALSQLAEAFGGDWLIHHAAHRSDEVINGTKASGMMQRFDLPPDDRHNHYRPCDDIRTRIGSGRIEIPIEMTSFSGAAISSMTVHSRDLPKHYFAASDRQKFSAVKLLETKTFTEFEFAGVSFIYDQTGLRRIDNSSGPNSCR